MDLLTVKIIAITGLGIISLIFGLIPIKMRRCFFKDGHKAGGKRQVVLSFFLCFGAGVLFAAVMIHMMPEIREGFDRVRMLQEKSSTSKDVHVPHVPETSSISGEPDGMRINAHGSAGMGSNHTNEDAHLQASKLETHHEHDGHTHSGSDDDMHNDSQPHDHTHDSEDNHMDHLTNHHDELRHDKSLDLSNNDQNLPKDDHHNNLPAGQDPTEIADSADITTEVVMIDSLLEEPSDVANENHVHSIARRNVESENLATTPEDINPSETSMNPMNIEEHEITEATIPKTDVDPVASSKDEAPSTERDPELTASLLDHNTELPKSGGHEESTDKAEHLDGHVHDDHTHDDHTHDDHTHDDHTHDDHTHDDHTHDGHTHHDEHLSNKDQIDNENTEHLVNTEHPESPDVTTQTIISENMDDTKTPPIREHSHPKELIKHAIPVDQIDRMDHDVHVVDEHEEHPAHDAHAEHLHIDGDKEHSHHDHHEHSHDTDHNDLSSKSEDHVHPSPIEHSHAGHEDHVDKIERRGKSNILSESPQLDDGEQSDHTGHETHDHSDHDDHIEEDPHSGHDHDDHIEEDPHTGHDHDNHTEEDSHSGHDHDHSDHDDHPEEGPHTGHDHEEDSHSYPLTELIICAGLFLVYFVEELVSKIIGGHGPHGGHGHSHIPLPSHNSHSHKNGKIHSKEHSGYKKKFGSRGAWTPAKMDGIENPAFSEDSDSTSWNSESKTEHSFEEQPRRFSSNPSSVSTEVAEPLNCSQILLSNIRSLLMVLALSFHSTFEGLAIGLQENATDVWYLTLAVAAHKLVIHFSVSLELLTIGVSTFSVLLYTFVMALTNPIGGSLGMFLTADINYFSDPTQLFTITVLQALSGGTILYVVFFEIMERERGKEGSRMTKFFAFLIGFAFLAIIENFGGHSHGPAESGHDH